jgi:hypothetical protein
MPQFMQDLHDDDSGQPERQPADVGKLADRGQPGGDLVGAGDEGQARGRNEEEGADNRRRGAEPTAPAVQPLHDRVGVDAADADRQ